MEKEDSLSPGLKKVLSSARQKHVPGGQIILYERDIPQEVYIIKKGVIKIYDIDEQGNEKILHLIKEPGLIPFAFFSGFINPLHWFYATLTDCDLYVIPADKLKQAVIDDGQLGEMLTKGFSTDVHELMVRLSSLGKTNAKDKIIAALHFLVVMHCSERRSGWWRVNFAVSHQLLADLCGITRESAAVVMKEMQDQKITRSPRQTILEINRQKLESIE